MQKFIKLIFYLFAIGALFAPTVLAFEAVQIAQATANATVGVYSRIDDDDKYYGSGVIISADGYILTATTVVPENANEIEIYFAHHQRERAEIIAVNRALEIVLLKVNNVTALPFLALVENFPLLGEPAFASGNANNMLKLGDGAAFSAGVVSGIYESENADAQSDYHGLIIETNCAINPGQDGGALVNAQAQVIGIISRGFSLPRWQGIAIPSSRILNELPALKKIAINKVTAKHPNLWGKLAERFRPALVGLEIERRYPPEKIARKSWREFRQTVSDWQSLSDGEKRRMTADFFAADSVLAANQMVRRPPGKVSGVLISAHGHLATSAFNLHREDRVFIDAKGNISLPQYRGDLTALTAPADFETVNQIISITATLADGRVGPARIISVTNHLAILQIEITEKISYLDLSLAAPTRAGEAIALIGSTPLTINTGIVSANNLTEGLFQFDAWLNYANSGGVIISPRGQFLGLAGSPLSPAPLMGKLLPFTPKMLDQPALSEYTNCPNSGIGLAISAEEINKALMQAR